MAEINSVTLIGRVVRDAEIKYTPSGLAVTKVSIAVNSRKKEGDNWVDKAQFFDIGILGKSAEAVTKFLTKGKQIGVHGELVQQTWEKDGKKNSKIEILAKSIQLLGSPGQKGEENPPSNNSSSEEAFEDDLIF